MKNIFTIITAVLITSTIWAQSPQKMSYQTVIRNTSNQLVTTQVGMKISILQGPESGTPVFVETHTPTPNGNGLVSIEIGGGTPVTGTFAAIVWSAGPYFIKTETAVTAPLTTYTITGTSQLLSIPYALYSNASGGGWSLTGNAGLTDGTSFIGSTDNVPFNIRVNNQRAGRIDPTLQNTFWGYQSGNSNTTGNQNTAIGVSALFNNTTGTINTANGVSALFNNTTGNFNTAIGTRTLFSNTTGAGNTVIGGGALYSNTTGNQNTAIGREALNSNVAGNNGVAIGYYSQYAANNTATPYDNTNTSVGYQSLRGSDTPANNTGTDNTAIGRDALFSNSTGSSNTANGNYALRNTSTGIQNTGIGRDALFSNTSGNSNTANGAGALYNNTTGIQNTAIGRDALATGATFSNSTAIGYNAQVTASNMIRLGNANVTSINGAVAFTVVSDRRFKKDIQENVSGLPFIMKLRPVSYHLDMDKIAAFMKTPENLRERASEALKEKVLQTGFIAQEVENVAQELGYDFSGIDKPDNENDYYGLRYAEFTVPLVKAVQEQQKMIESLKEEIRRLKDQSDNKQSALSKLESENLSLKSDFESRLKKLEEMLGALAQK
jgi:FtsZ-binding cell division protein ZapB